MTLRAVFAPLLRALTGGRYPARAGAPAGGLALGGEWYELLAQLGLPPGTFHEVLAAELQRLSAEPAKRYGVQLNRVGVRDVILPGEVRQVMMQEVQADRAGRAELVRARHELAAARARANTAKILSENPEVARLQEIEALVNLAGKSGNVVLLPNLADLFAPRRKEGG